MFTHHKKSLNRISALLKAKLPGNFVAMYAFGSRARGDHGQESDFDVLVIVEKRVPQVEVVIIDLFLKDEIENGMSFDPVIKTLASFELEKKYHTPFYENVIREGMMV